MLHQYVVLQHGRITFFLHIIMYTIENDDDGDVSVQDGVEPNIYNTVFFFSNRTTWIFLYARELVYSLAYLFVCCSWKKLDDC